MLFNPRYISRNLSGIGTRSINNREIPQEIALKVEYSLSKHGKSVRLFWVVCVVVGKEAFRMYK